MEEKNDINALIMSDIYQNILHDVVINNHLKIYDDYPEVLSLQDEKK